MNCEKCKQGVMDATKVSRFSGCLVAIGYTLLIPSILALGVATIMAVMGTFATGKATVDSAERLKNETLVESSPDRRSSRRSDIGFRGGRNHRGITACQPPARSAPARRSRAHELHRRHGGSCFGWHHGGRNRGHGCRLRLPCLDSSPNRRLRFAPQEKSVALWTMRIRL